MIFLLQQFEFATNNAIVWPSIRIWIVANSCWCLCFKSSISAIFVESAKSTTAVKLVSCVCNDWTSFCNRLMYSLMFSGNWEKSRHTGTASRREKRLLFAFITHHFGHFRQCWLEQNKEKKKANWMNRIETRRRRWWLFIYVDLIGTNRCSRTDVTRPNGISSSYSTVQDNSLDNRPVDYVWTFEDRRLSASSTIDVVRVRDVSSADVRAEEDSKLR